MQTLIYPSKRTISNAEVIQWARDRMVDDEIAKAIPDGDDLDDVEMMDDIATEAERVTPWPTLREAMAKLEDDGVATFQKGGDRG